MSLKSSLMIAGPFVKCRTYSRNSRPFSRMWRITPPRNAMSLPARIGTCRSAIALVRVKRGSTWMTFAPRSLASITHWKPTGWHSAMFDPMIRMQSERCRSCRNVVAPPRPNDVPRPGTVELCHMRAWFSIWIAPIAVKSFLMR